MGDPALAIIMLPIVGMMTAGCAAIAFYAMIKVAHMVGIARRIHDDHVKEMHNFTAVLALLLSDMPVASEIRIVDDGEAKP